MAEMKGFVLEQWMEFEKEAKKGIMLEQHLALMMVGEKAAAKDSEWEIQLEQLKAI